MSCKRIQLQQLYWGLLLAEQLVAAALLLIIFLRLFGTLLMIWHLPVVSLSLPCLCFLGICAFSNANVAGRSCTLAQKAARTFHVEKNICEVDIPTGRIKRQRFPEVQRWHLPWRSRGAASWLSAPRRRPDGALVLFASLPTWQQITTNKADVFRTFNHSEHSEDVEWDWVTGCDCQDLQVNSAYDMFQRSNAQIETWLWFARLQGRGKADQQRIFMARFGSGALITTSFGLLQWTLLANTEGNRTGELRFRSTHMTIFDT